MVTYEELYLRLPKERQEDLKEFVVAHGASRQAQTRPFKESWQEAVDAAAIEVEKWLAEDTAAGLVGLPDELLIALVEV